MRTMMVGFLVFSILGVIIFTGQGFGNSLDSSTLVNKIGAVKIFDNSAKTMIGMNLGTTDTITSITLTFKTSIEDETVNISLTDSDNLEIGTGSQFVSPSNTVVTITLSDSITANERDLLKNVDITIS